MSRRMFVRHCLAAGLGFATTLRVDDLRGEGAAAEPPPYEGPYYVVFNASGGWDTT